jgi:hypothetical protein
MVSAGVPVNHDRCAHAWLRSVCCPLLFAAGNPLNGVPESIENCRSLTYVNLQDTHIYSLPLELSRLPGLTNVGLSQEKLKSKLASAYGSGTKRLMEYLARKDEKRALRDQLRQRLRCEVSLPRRRPFWGDATTWC